MLAVNIRKEVRQYQNLERHDDIRLDDSWIEFGDDRKCDFLVYKMRFKDEDTNEWNEAYKAVRFSRLVGVPRELREQESMMDIFGDILSGIWSSDIDFVHVVARVRKPVERVLFLYGAQGVSTDLEEAKDIAREGYAAIRAGLRGSFAQLRLEQLSAEDAETLREKMYDMRYVQMIRGIPKARRAAAGSSQSSLMGHLANPEEEQQLEELVRGIENEFVMITVASPVPFRSINTWLHNHAREQSVWESEKQGTKGISAGLSLPMVLAGSTGLGESTSTSLSEGVSETIGSSVTETIGVSEGVGYSEGTTDTVGENYGVSESVGQSKSVSYGESETHSTSWSQSETHTIGTSYTQSEGQSEGVSRGESISHSTGTSESWGESESYGTSQSISDSTSYSRSQSTSTSHSQGLSSSEGQSWNEGTSGNTSYNRGVNVGRGENLGHSQGFGESRGFSGNTSESTSLGSDMGRSSSQNFSIGGNKSIEAGVSAGRLAQGGTSTGGSLTHQTGTSSSSGLSSGVNYGTSQGWNQGMDLSESFNRGWSSSFGESEGISIGEGWSRGQGFSQSTGTSESWGSSSSTGLGEGVSQSLSRGESLSHGTSFSRGFSESTSRGETVGFSSGRSFSTSVGTSESISRGTSYGESVSRGVSRGESFSESLTRSDSYGQSVSRSQSESQSYSRSTTDSEARGFSKNRGESQSTGYSQGLTQSRGMSASMAFGPSISASKSVQWKRMDIETLVEIMEYQRARLRQMVNSGGWFVDVYLLTSDIEAKEQAALLARSAFWAGDSLPQPVQVIEPDEEWNEHLLVHASCFSACTARENTPELMEPYKFSTILLPQELSAYTHIPRGEFGGVSTVTERIPLLAVPETTGNLYMGKVISPETGDVTNIPYHFNENTLMHTLVAGASGTGKTVSSIRYVNSILEHVGCGAVILDWKMDWRSLLQFLPPERGRFYGLDPGSTMPIEMNLLEPPEYISPTTWRDKVIESMCVAFGLGTKQYGILYKHLTELFYENDIIRFVAFRRDGTTRVIEKNYQENQDGYRSIKIPENGYPEVHPDWRENIRHVTLATLYMRLREVREIGLDRNSRGLADTYDSLLTRLEYYVSGELRRLYASERREAIRISDFVHGSMVTVLEGGNLDSLNKVFVITLFMEGLFMYAKEKFRRNGNKVDSEVLVVLEEAHNVIPGSRSNNDTPLPITESIWEVAFNEARGYGLYLTAIVQVPSAIPTNITANCSNLIVHRLGNEEDTNVVSTLLIRDSQRDHRDIPRFLTRLPVGMAVVKQSRVRNLWEMEPAVIAVDYLTVDTPSDEVLVDLLESEK